MTGEHDFDAWSTRIFNAYHVPPINAFRALALGLDGSNAVPIKVASDGTVATSGGGSSSGNVTANAGLGTFQIAGIVTANAGLGTWSVVGTVTSTIASMPAITGIVTANAGLGTFNTGLVQYEHTTVPSAPITGTLALGFDSGSGNVSAIKVDGAGRVYIKSDATLDVEEASVGSDVTFVSASASSVTILASAVGRKAALFFNDSTAVAYLKFGPTASTTSFSVLMRGGDFYEMPFPYEDQVDCIWASATGAMRITEFFS